MGLALRKEKILSAVVESYIRSGEPIGSKALLEETDLNVSSATVRNELKALDDEGYLRQPHTSAGRVPTKKGYRYYIDNLMKPAILPERLRESMERNIRSAGGNPESILTRTASVLSQLTKAAAAATTPSSDDARVHRIRFVSTGRHTSMAVLVASNGMVKSRLFRCEFVLTPQLLSMFDKAVNEAFTGVKLMDVTQGFLQTAASGMGELTLFIPDVLVAIYEAVQDALQINVTVAGQTNLLFSDSYDFDSARNTIRFLSDTKSISGLLNNSRTHMIYLGEESKIPELRNSAVVSARYEIGGENAGAVAVIAPLRIDYRTIMSEVIYAAGCVSRAIGDLL
ncbi:MAG: heat-inducible transcription repressor HrcA [Ruminococcus sp.]|nr:heat-inducible transcription repressor HrcA [Ruminococcus sp.]